jgi:glutamate decarboxylase
MVFYCDYLGTLERSITLNFSRGASQIVGQYYQLLRLGKEGYTKIMSNLSKIAAYIRNYIVNSDHFDLVSQEIGVPLVAFKLKSVKHSDGTLHKRLYDEFQVAERVRIAGYVSLSMSCVSMNTNFIILLI